MAVDVCSGVFEGDAVFLVVLLALPAVAPMENFPLVGITSLHA